MLLYSQRENQFQSIILHFFMIDSNTPLITIPRPTDTFLLRKAIVANAYSMVGVSAYQPTRKLFEGILGKKKYAWDLDRPFKAKLVNGKWVTEGVSTCGLVARGLWRRMNVDMQALYENYIDGTALSAEIIFARKHKAWQAPWKDMSIQPELGDYVIVGSGLATHALTAVAWKGEEIPTLVSVDGGQITGAKSLQCIKKVERVWTKRSKEQYAGDRKVIGWIVFDMLPFRGNSIVVPQGWETLDI